MPALNPNINHIALSVPNLEDAIKFYTSAFNVRQINDIMVIDLKGEESGPLNLIYGEEVRQLRMCFLSAGNNVGLELFEFINPPYTGAAAPGWNREKYTRGGVFHFCFTDPDPLATLERAVKLGAKQVGQAITQTDDQIALYLQDPWGNVIELLTVNWEHMYMRKF
ncbi:hypothetical protein RBB50_003533 [Rhinocladiella similis]